MKILLTGGTGYIGSHVAVELINRGYDVTIVDNLSNSKISVLERIKRICRTDNIAFYNINLLDYNALEKVFIAENCDAVMHFAGLKAVKESVEEPLDYYENNIMSTLNLLKAMQKFGVKSIVFSSSATVYGENSDAPFYENYPLSAVNPYGRTKLFIEEILRDYHSANPDTSVCLLRYFNPVGAHSSGLIGEDPNGIPNNLMPLIVQVASGERDKLYVFGNDYPTEDGTCIRDYIHVVDLAMGHILALEKHSAFAGLHVHNLGRGTGVSVLDMVKTFQTVNMINVKFEIGSRREGDIAISYAATEKARRELGWTPALNLEDMCRDSWNWHKKNLGANE